MLPPAPDKSAGDRRFVAMLQLMARNFAVDLWVVYPGKQDDYPTQCQKFADIGVNLIEHGPKWKISLAVVLGRRDYDFALFEFYTVFLSQVDLFRRLQPWTILIIDTVDVHFLRESMALAFGIGSAEAVEAHKQLELSAYRSADGLILVTDVDALALAAEIDKPGATVIIPIILPLRDRIVVKRDPDVLFVGGFKHPPNVDGIKWFVEGAWPAVRRAMPDAHLTIVGNDPPESIKALHSDAIGVEVVGYVPDINPYLDRSAISVAPLRYGAGMKGKVCEAMASGLPVLTTSCGAQGLAAVSNKHILIEDTLDGLADALIALLQDPERADSIGLSGQAHIASVCNSEKIEFDILTFMMSLLPNQRQLPSPLLRKHEYVKARTIDVLLWLKYGLKAWIRRPTRYA